MDYRLTIHGHLLRVYVDSAKAQADAKLAARMARLEAALNLLPERHVKLIVEPIVVVDRFAGGRATGGGFFTPHAVGPWISESGARNTGVSVERMKARLAEGGDTGLVAISCEAFLDSTDYDGHWACEYTLLHEVGHSVDLHAGLIPAGPVADRYGNAPYQGMRYSRPSLGEFAAEAYSRFFLRPSAMCRGGKGTPPCITPAGTPASTKACPNQRRCSGRLQRDLRATPAFAGSGVVFPLALNGDGGPTGTRFAHQGPPGTSSRQTIASVNASCSWMQPGPLGERAPRDAGKWAPLAAANPERARCEGHG